MMNDGDGFDDDDDDDGDGDGFDGFDDDDDDGVYLMMNDNPGGHPCDHQHQVPQDCQASKYTEQEDLNIFGINTQIQILLFLANFWCYFQMLLQATSDREQTEFHKVEINLHILIYSHFTFKIYKYKIYTNTQIQMYDKRTPIIPEAFDCRYI